MKKLGYIFITFIETILLIGSFAFYYFAKKRMGMARYVIYKNQKFEMDYPVEAIRYILLFTILILTIFTIVLYLKNIEKGTIPKITIIATLTIVLFFLAFTVSQSKETVRAYYFIGLFTALVSILQIGKSICIIKRKG